MVFLEEFMDEDGLLVIVECGGRLFVSKRF